MKTNNQNDLFDSFFNIIIIMLGLIGVSSIISLFESDSSKIVSKKGKQLLSDPQRMEEINNLIDERQQTAHHSEVVI